MQRKILSGRSRGIPGKFVIDTDGYLLGFVPDNYTGIEHDTIILGADNSVVLVILRDGTLQNPDGTKSAYTDPIQYVLDHVHSGTKWIGSPLDADEQLLRDGTKQHVVEVAGLSFTQRLLPNDQGLFILLGAALADIQAFETLLSGFLTSLDRSKGKVKPQENYDDLLEKNYSKTLGGIINAFRNHIHDAETADALDYAKNRRNFLVHGILRKYGWWEMSNTEYRICAFEISEIRSAIKLAEDRLVRYLNDSQAMQVLQIEFDPATDKFIETGAGLGVIADI